MLKYMGLIGVLPFVTTQIWSASECQVLDEDTADDAKDILVFAEQALKCFGPGPDCLPIKFPKFPRTVEAERVLPDIRAKVWVNCMKRRAFKRRFLPLAPWALWN